MLSKLVKKHHLLIYTGFFIITLIPLIFSEIKTIKDLNVNSELFRIELTQFKNVNDLMAHIDGIYTVNHPVDKIDTSAYVNICSDVVKKRFYHGLAEYSIFDNWIAWLSGKLIWSHFLAIVEPDDILKHSAALCSQQSIVFMDLLNRKGIKNRNVGISSKEGNGHFLTEVYYKSSWHLFDVNKEPNWDSVLLAHQSMEFYLKNKDSLYKIYDGKLTPIQINYLTETIYYGQSNEFPAKNMLIFHRLTKLLTCLLPNFFLIMILISLFKQKKTSKFLRKFLKDLKLKRVNF